MSPAVDVVIAAHDPGRRVDRAVASVLDASRVAVRATVVAHGIPRVALEPQLSAVLDDPRLRIVEFADGVRSPAGPFRHGLALADGEFVAVLGSDDFLEPGAVDGWAAFAEASGTDYLIAPMRDQGGARWRDPLTRPFRRTRLDPVRDRLDYRAAPLGLIRRSYLERLGIGLTEGLATGEDIELGLALVNLGGRVDAPADVPAYVIGADAPQRVTLLARPASDELEALRRLSGVAWPTELAAARRRAIAIKLWRMNVIPAMLVRPSAGEWSAADLDALAAVAGWLRRLSPEASRSLSRTEATLAEAADARDAGAIERAGAAARAAGPAERVLTRRLVDALGTDTLARRVLRLRFGRAAG
ncbi:glycosyltransferase family 2 protein [Agromyces intestinalis]|uniref:Glycosyltransferase family 2 protein n=1 Tax=Agromyces intestinalis TaxID=2592652 RepID=A0A5C1YBU2_9MICO|nr:glycosyltransferase [Agromyces intestinalis]QEO13553.1 glycosyltransferase family 2 protein [Agromyces intestinalis]